MEAVETSSTAGDARLGRPAQGHPASISILITDSYDLSPAHPHDKEPMTAIECPGRRAPLNDARRSRGAADVHRRRTTLRRHDGDLGWARWSSPSTRWPPKRGVNSFVYLARYHYYDGLTFHRVIPGFRLLQGGCPSATGTGGPGYSFDDELPQAGRYQVGSLAMANAGPTQPATSSS